MRPSEIPQHDRPLSERYRIAGRVWAACRKTFRGYDKRKDIVFDELVLALMRQAQDNNERMTKTQAEAEARTSNVWRAYVDELLEAEHQANLAQVEMRALDMEHSERIDDNANARDERRSYRLGG